MPLIGTQHQARPRGRPQPAHAQHMQALAIRHRPAVQQEPEQLLEPDVRLGHLQVVAVLKAVQAGARRHRVPVEDRPGAAFQRRGGAVPLPVEVGLARERRDAEARQRDFDDPGDERASGCGSEPVAPEAGFDVADCEVGVEEGVEDGENAEDGEGDADVGYYVGGGGHCGKELFSLEEGDWVDGAWKVGLGWEGDCSFGDKNSLNNSSCHTDISTTFIPISISKINRAFPDYLSKPLALGELILLLTSM